MLFFEQDFFLLFGVFFVAYWRLTPKSRPLLIVITSYVFYAAWDWRFLSLLLLSTAIDHHAGLRIAATRIRKQRRRWLLLSLVANLGMLGTFKYFDFFSENFAQLFGIAPENRLLLDVILPAGISFYTFQTLSYVIDVYRGQARAERSLINFAAFVAFFPQLVAGPIERAASLLTQLKTPQRFSWINLREGARLFLYGLVKKLVIADNLSRFVDPVFAAPGDHPPLTLLLAAYCFAFQIYCDFSGYTDMARGLARTIGIELTLNFRAPYLAGSIRDFWRRWHMSLYRWFHDYIYIPLGGSRAGAWRTYRNVLIVFAISGLWHGAGWTFVLWGVLHGLFICTERSLAPTAFGKAVAAWPYWLRAVLVFHCVCGAWILFRSPDMATAQAYFWGLAGLRPADFIPGMTLGIEGLFPVLPVLGGHIGPAMYAMTLIVLAGPLMIAQWMKTRSYPPAQVLALPADLRVLYSMVLVLIVLWLRPNELSAFIYFQF